MHRILSTLCLLLAIFSSHLFAQQKIQIIVGEYPPLVSQHLKHYGVTARIIVEAFALEDVQVEYKFSNWARAFHLVEVGQAHGIGPILKNDKRENLYYFSDSLLYETQVFFHKKDYLFKWNNVSDLKTIQIGATLSYSYGKAFDQAEKSGELQIQRVPSDIQNFKKMFANRIQILPQSLDVGYYMLQTEFPDKASSVTHHPKSINQSNNYLALSKKKPNSLDLLMRFNRGLKKLKANGKYDQYFKESRRGDYIIKE